jgi:magnesium transporter
MRRIKYSEVRKVVTNLFEYTGLYKTDPVNMQIFVYDGEGYEEYVGISLEKIAHEINDPEQKDDVIWLNVHGLHDVANVRSIGEIIGVDSQIIADVLNVQRRSRMDDLHDVLFFSIKSVLQKQESESLKVEQISFMLKDNILVSFQERKSDFFSHIRERIRTGNGIVRKKHNDYLLYLMLDAVMENFFVTIENYELQIEEMMAVAKKDGNRSLPEKIEENRENLYFLKRSILPLRDALYTLKGIAHDDDHPGIEKSNHAYFARLHQKALELLEQIDYDINLMESVSNIFFSTQNQRMNQIMKTLTIFSGIFMPLTFIVGVYGMNFDNMPELRSENGYFITLGAMVAIALALIVYFKVKRWF